MSDSGDTSLARHKAAIVAMGLDFDMMEVHAARVRAAVRSGAKPRIEILDTCRLDNDAILPLAAVAMGAATPDAQDFIAFVPSAGAASRYSMPLAKLLQALEDEARDELDAIFSSLIAEGAEKWPLPASIAQHIRSRAKLSQVPQTELAELARDLNLPKALMPCVKEGTSFLAMKVREHEKMPDLAAEVYVTPPGMPYTFASALAKADRPSRLPLYFLEQGKRLSTLRFRADGEVYLDSSGKPSAVPAGHGALAQLFPAAGRCAPGAHSLFIRNIDNVMGTSAAALDATHLFLAGHRRVFQAVRGIRAALEKSDVERAAKIAEPLLVDAAARQLAPLDVLAAVQARLFHTSPALPHTTQSLLALYRRPVNTVGQVPNTGRDVGGTPCFIKGTAGSMSKLCVEVPHASENDKAAFLANPAKATHFNPVFVAAEITLDPDYYARNNRDFWLLSEKSYRGDKVLYHETILYELLGNSDLANCMFVEVPRLVFHPHKTLADATCRPASHWLG